MPLSLFPPEPCETYEIKLADETVQRGFWSGKAWWVRGQPVAPIAWRPIATAAQAA